MSEQYLSKYQAAAGANVVISAAPGFLKQIIIGKAVTGGVIEVSDSLTDGDGDIKVYLEDGAVGSYDINARFLKGITADLTTQTNVTFIYR